MGFGKHATMAYNNVVGASARLRRAPEYTAPKACGLVNDEKKLGGAWPRSSRAGAASPTSERYPKPRSRSGPRGVVRSRLDRM
jgi:hypothetical protein